VNPIEIKNLFFEGDLDKTGSNIWNPSHLNARWHVGLVSLQFVFSIVFGHQCRRGSRYIGLWYRWYLFVVSFVYHFKNERISSALKCNFGKLKFHILHEKWVMIFPDRYWEHTKTLRANSILHRRSRCIQSVATALPFGDIDPHLSWTAAVTRSRGTTGRRDAKFGDARRGGGHGPQAADRGGGGCCDEDVPKGERTVVASIYFITQHTSNIESLPAG